MVHAWGSGSPILLKALTSLFIAFYSMNAMADFDLSNRDKVVKKYEAYHKRFSRIACRPGTEEKFNELYKKYLSFGFYIPLLDGDKVDIKTIKENLSLLKDKIRFIQSNDHFLENNYNQLQVKRIINKLDDSLHQAAKEKTLYKINQNDEQLKKSQAALEKLSNDFVEMINAIPFLLSFMFPVDYFELRRQYDSPDNRENKNLRNKIFFIRKIVEDGAQEKGAGRNDKFLRSLLSTTYLRLKNQSNFMEDELYYDLDDLVDKLRRQIGYGKKQLIERNQEWLDRTKNILDFYKDIIQNYEKHPAKLASYIKNQKLARRNLQNYVQTKQRQTFLYWMNRPELYRAIYSLETILMNEVGRLDVDGALERREISRVVEGRTQIDEYSIPAENSGLYTKIKSKIGKKYLKYPWLNTLFKEGEFSFTYYFIHASVRTFCPEMTYAGKRLRSENIEIAIDALKENKKTEAVRYFSRASMLGRISMHKIWSRFEAITEAPGLRIKDAERLVKKLKNKDFYWLYDFKYEGDTYWAVEISKKRYYFELGTEYFYNYRNPYYFTYFKEKSLN